jgi:creatinine amidohydrolase
VSSLILPPVAFSVAEMGADFAGTLAIPAATATALLRDVAVVASKKFRAVVFANMHFEPGHVECVKKAVEEAKKAGASVATIDVTKKRWAELMGEALEMATEHAGSFETSLMLAAAPSAVRDVRRSLAPVEGYEASLKNAKTFADAGGEDAYFGDPTAASAEDGDTYFEGLAEILALSVMEHLGSKA